MNPRDNVLSDGELLTLAAKLDLVTTDLVSALAHLSTATMSCTGVAGPHVQSQPSSRPPYNMGAEIVLDELRNELGTTIRHICEHRVIDVPKLASLTAMAGWLRKHRVAIAVMEDGKEIHRKLCTVIDRAVRSAGQEEREYRISQAMVDEANRQVVTGDQVEKMAYKLGDRAKGLTARRVKHLRERGLLAGTKDSDTGTWFYYLGSVLAAHEQAKATRARPAVRA